MGSQVLSTELKDSVGVIKLNRPEKLNSINTELAAELLKTLSDYSEEQNVKAILLTGEGRAFCAGQDLEEVKPRPDGSVPDLQKIVEQNYNPLVKKITEIDKLVICAVNGVAAGAGANIALACDVVFAGESASFIQSFKHVGLIPDSGGTFSLARLVGLGKARGLIYSADKVSAKEAEAMGMIYKVIEDSELENAAQKFAKQIAEGPSLGFSLTKRALREGLTNDLNKQLDLEEKLQGQAGKSHDYKEGVEAFIEKRKPEFKGN